MPGVAGHLVLEHYLDARREDPPAHDALMTVAYVKAYHNTTTHDEPLSTCYDDVNGNVCVVPDQRTPPNPNGKKTHFYSAVPGEDEDNKDDEVTIGHVGYAQPKGPPSTASVATLCNGVLFASGLLLVAVVYLL